MNISLTKLPWYAQVSAFLLLGAGGVFAFYTYYESPAQTDMAMRQQQLRTLKADIAKGQATAKKLPEFEAQVGELEARLADLRAVLPEEKDAADLLRRMQTVAMQSNLTITSFKPAPVSMKELHAEWPINLELSGTYHNLAQFFDRIGHFTQIVNISGLQVKGKADKTDSSTTIAAECIATTFVLLEKPEPKPAAKAKPKTQKKVA